ncbi:hypothetical protein D1007_30044 [Hordeum vulgare]|nr:hypothetical protein D1007_30044 [Hordeum vulgare]
MDGHFFSKGEQERGEVQDYVGCAKGEDGVDRTRVERRLEIEREKTELEKQEAAIKWELQKVNTFEEIELEKERLQLSRDVEDAKILLVDESTLDEYAKKWLAEKKEINDRRALEAARAAMVRQRSRRTRCRQMR